MNTTTRVIATHKAQAGTYIHRLSGLAGSQIEFYTQDGSFSHIVNGGVGEAVERAWREIVNA